MNKRISTMWILLAGILLAPPPTWAVVILEDIATYWRDELAPTTPNYTPAWFDLKSTASSLEVTPLPPGLEAVLPIRLAKLSYYLNLDTAYQDRVLRGKAPPPSDNTKQNRVLAYMEQFLIHSLYEHEATAPERRCGHWHAQQRLLVNIRPQDLATVADKPLTTLYQTVQKQFTTGNQTNPLPCQLQAIHTQGEVRQWAKEAVDAELLRQIQARMAKQKQLMDEANKGLIKLETNLNAAVMGIPTEEVFELERTVGNVAANLALVVNDKMQLAQLLQAMDATKNGTTIPFKELHDLIPASKAILDASATTIQDMNTPFLRLVGSLEQVPLKIGHCQFRQPLMQHCQGLENLGNTSAVSVSPQQFGACLVTTHEFITYFQAHPEEEKNFPILPQLDALTTPSSSGNTPEMANFGRYSALIQALTQGLATLPQRMEYCYLWEELQSCRGLTARYNAITSLTPITRDDFVTAFNQCASKTAALLSQLTQPNPKDILGNTFGTALQPLSTATATAWEKHLKTTGN